MEVHNISVTEDYEEIRIDKYLADFFPDYSRSYIQQLIKDNMIKVNHNNIKSSYRLSTDDMLEISIPEPKVLEVKPQNLNLDILYEDADIIIVNKEKHRGFNIFNPKLDVGISSACSGFVLLNKTNNNMIAATPIIAKNIK